jgi:signal transduction histidine kinase
VSSNLEHPAPVPGLARAQPAQFSASRIDQLARGLLRNAWWALTLLVLLILLIARNGPSLTEFRVTSASRSACDGSNASEVGLPHYDWGRDCTRILASRHLTADQTIEQSLVVTGVGRDARIWINGNLLREFDARAGFDSTSQPLLLPLQPGILHRGDNELLFQVRSGIGRYDRTYLGTILLGPDESLAPAFERIRVLGVSGAQLAIIVGVAILLTLLPMALLRRGEREHRWFALSVLCSLVYIWNMGWPLRPLPAELWHILAHAALGLALWGMLRFSFIQAGSSPDLRAWVDRIMAISLAALLSRLISDDWWPVTIGEAIYRSGLIVLLIVLTVYWWRRRSQMPIARWLAAAAVLNIVLSVADSLRLWTALKGEIAPYLVHWGILYMLVLLLIGQIKRILEALHTAEHAQQQLSAALEQRSRELQHQFALRQQAEQARTLAEERQRIMRDMHDGVGGQLVALIGQADHGTLDEHKLKLQLRRSLDDLRLMIDSLDDACADLGVALGMLRQRLQSSLKDLPIAVHWQTAQLPDLAPRAPDEVLQVLRIVQESITNALKHARCRKLEITADWNQGWLEICVQDDGIGLSETAARGRGLPGMQLRASRIGATIEIADHPPGTRVRLRMPQELA